MTSRRGMRATRPVGGPLPRVAAVAIALTVAAGALGSPPSEARAAGPVGTRAEAVAAAGDRPVLAAGVPGPTAARPWTYDLYERGDFASQANKKRCVAGAMQTMVNVMNDGADHSARLQDRLHRLAVRLAHPMEHVIGPYGWARALQASGYGRYTVRAYRTRDAALKAAALAVRRTGRPAGLMVWRGAHSWVLHGFQASADPLLVPKARIRAYVISDPWYPRISSIWGPSKPPDSTYVPAELIGEYLPWKRPDGRYPGWDGRFLVVEPVAPRSHWWHVD